MNMETEIERKAREFATRCHESVGQVRKYTGEPYINHPAAVVDIVRSVPHSDEMIAAAWLHDTVEDTPATLHDLEAAFGVGIAALVEMLTDVSRPSDGNRGTRKEIDRAHTAQASPDAQTIKLADLIDNSYSIIERDRKFSKVYLAEKQELLKVLTHGDPVLHARAAAIVRANSGDKK